MKKNVFAVLTALTVCVSGAAFAAPQTTFQEGQVQVDVGAMNTKLEILIPIPNGISKAA